MLAARLVEKLADARQRFDDGLVFGNFAVEHAQRIGHGATLAIRIHSVLHRIEGLAQGFIVRGTILGTSDRIQLQLPAGDAEPIEQGSQQFDNFPVPRGRLAASARGANDFRADLIELAIASFLWPLPPKLRPDVIELVQPAVPELVLDVGADDSGSILRTKCEG